ncbi:MAG: hypothetical protein MSC31_16935 [Solirubrobacteraceae bacterium MAG38_C4-C5]|nr:hypothetical protein [Candidatus Siliceabacter maunaloa]
MSDHDDAAIAQLAAANGRASTQTSGTREAQQGAPGIPHPAAGAPRGGERTPRTGRNGRGRKQGTRELGRLAALRAALERRRSTRTLALEAESLSTRLGWAAPARTISVAGVHGGAGTSTLCLLVAHAIARYGESPALTVDLAGRSRGGLAVLGGAAGQTTAEATAAAARNGGGLREPFAINAAGVRIVGTDPDGVTELDRSHEALVARLGAVIEEGHSDAHLGEVARLALGEHRTWQALRWDNGHATEDVAGLLDQAAEHHALVAVDLGMLDSPPLAHTLAARSHLHVWVVPADARSMEITTHRLPRAPFEPQGAEAICVWARNGAPVPSSKRLSALGDLRGCPVVRLADHGPSDDWATRLLNCLAGVSELCELAR